MADTAAPERIHFAGLHALRGLAALSVVVSHVEGFRAKSGMPHHNDMEWMRALGPSAVNFFFCLSGFLITYLLFEERRRAGDIDVKRFYVRRALRIWPLYFTVVLAGLLVFPAFIDAPGFVDATKVNGALLWGSLLFFAPNLTFAAFGHVRFLGPTWSIGVEEQFYLLWPFLVRVCRRTKTFLGLMMILFIGLFACRTLVLLHRLPQPEMVSDHVWGVMTTLVRLSRFEFMLCGAAAAVLVFHRRSLVDKLFSPVVQAAGIVLWWGVLASGFAATPVGQLGQMLSVVVILVGTSCHPRPLLRLNGKAWDTLGQLSFGIYLLHAPVLLGVLDVGRRWGADPHAWTTTLATHVAAVVLTVLLAAASYRLLESPFLRLKKRFVVVHSGGESSTA